MIAIDVKGGKETIKALRRLDPELRKEFNRNARSIAKPITDLAKSRYTRLPLSGFRREWNATGRQLTPTTIGRFRSGVSFKTDTSKKNRALFVIQQRNPLAEIFDMAGRKGANQLDRSLQAAGWGTASRVMWPAAEARLSEVQNALRHLVADAAKTVEQGMPK